MLVLFNVVPLVIGFVLLARLVERFGTTDWGRIFVMAAAVFGTFLDHVRRGDQQPSAGGGLRGGGRLRRGAHLVRRRAAAAISSSSPGCSARWRRPTSFRRCRCWPPSRSCCSGKPRG